MAPNIGLQRTSRRSRAAAEAGSFARPSHVCLAIAFGVVALLGCTSTSRQSAFGRAETRTADVSLATVVADPKAFEGNRFRTHGYLRLAFEGNALYSSQSALGALDLSNSLWINLNPAFFGTTREILSNLNGHRVAVEATVDTLHHGHMGRYPAELSDVTYIARDETGR